MKRSTAVIWTRVAVIAFCVLALNTVANLASKSRLERALMTPAAFVCAVCLLVAALSHPIANVSAD